MSVIIGKRTSIDGLMLWPPTKSIKEITGRRFGRLLVLGTAWKRVVSAKSRYYVSCLCDCGEECVVDIVKIKNGHTRSCGCFHTENLIKAVTKHGESNWSYKNGRGGSFSIVYSKWVSAKARCLYPSTEGYEHYGAIGITICDGYVESYELFRDDLGDRPTIEHTLDRIDTHGSYSCGRCGQCKKNGWKMNIRWADKDTQNNNKRNSVWIEYNGERLTAAQWGRKLGVKGATIIGRIKNGWEVADAITVPIGKYLGASRKFKKQ